MDTSGVVVLIGLLFCQMGGIITAPAGGGIPPLISFKDGTIGVNFLGYHASAGLGGLLGGNPAGGLHAEAGTPFGQRAAAGLRGGLGNGGQAGGELYAGATAGGNIKAAAGLGGGVSGGEQPFAGGTLYSGASAPGVASGASLDGVSDGFINTVQKTYVANAPKVPVKKTVYYQSNNVDSDSEEHEVRQVKVTKMRPAKIHKHGVVQLTARQGSEEFPAVVSSHGSNPPPSFTGFGNTFLSSFLSPSYVHQPHESIPVSHGATVEKRVSYDANGSGGAGFFQDIFNIPISTLHAVSRFLGNAGGNVNVQKSVAVHQ